MMLSLNKVIIAGKLIKILPKKDTKSMLIQEVEVETEECFYSKQSNSQESKKEKVKVTFFGKSAEMVVSIPLGSTVMIEGKVRSATYKTQQGKDFDTTTVTGSKLTFEPTKKTSEKENEMQPYDFESFDDDIAF